MKRPEFIALMLSPLLAPLVLKAKPKTPPFKVAIKSESAPGKALDYMMTKRWEYYEVDPYWGSDEHMATMGYGREYERQVLNAFSKQVDADIMKGFKPEGK